MKISSDIKIAILDIFNNPYHISTQRTVSKAFGISERSVRKILSGEMPLQTKKPKKIKDLTKKDIKNIFNLHKHTSTKKVKIAKKYNISIGTFYTIIRTKGKK